MRVQLSDHFTFGRLIRFTLPSIVMMVFTSIYGVVDGYFISNYAGSTAFAGVNFIMPYLMVLGAAGFVFGDGGGALVAKTLGEGDDERANQIFSMFVCLTIIAGVAVMAAGLLTIRPLAAALGAQDQLLEDAVLYATIGLLPLPLTMLQFAFQSFFVTASRPQLGLAVMLAAGAVNIVLDIFFVGMFGWGVAGAAAATALSESTGGLIPILYFARRNGSRLRLCRTRLEAAPIFRGITNGLSELVSSISGPLAGMLCNVQLLKYAGENGVAAYGVLMYMNFVFVAMFIGFTMGTTPLVGFNYGAQNHAELQNLRKKGLTVISAFALGMTTAAELFGDALAQLFVGYNPALFEMTRHGFEIFSLCYLFTGFPMFIGGFFTGLNNGIISALITLSLPVIEVPCLLFLPIQFGVDGIWSAVVLAALLSSAAAFSLLFGFRKKYRY